MPGFEHQPQTVFHTLAGGLPGIAAKVEGAKDIIATHYEDLDQRYAAADERAAITETAGIPRTQAKGESDILFIAGPPDAKDLPVTTLRPLASPERRFPQNPNLNVPQSQPETPSTIRIPKPVRPPLPLDVIHRSSTEGVGARRFRTVMMGIGASGLGPISSSRLRVFETS